MNAEQMFDTGMSMTRGKKPVRDASTFFHQTPKGYVSTYRNIGHYLINMATYLRHDDVRYKGIAVRIFSRLPQYAKKRMHELGYIVHKLMDNPASGTTKKKSKFDEYGHFHGRIPKEAVKDCTRPGPADSAVAYWQQKLKFKVPRKLALSYLSEMGAWTDEELAGKSDDEIAQIVLWTACGDIKEQGEWFGLMH